MHILRGVFRHRAWIGVVCLLVACADQPAPQRISFPPERTLIESQDETWAQIICERTMNAWYVLSGHGVERYDDLGRPPQANGAAYTYSGTVTTRIINQVTETFYCEAKPDDNPKRPKGSWRIWRLDLSGTTIIKDGDWTVYSDALPYRD